MGYEDGIAKRLMSARTGKIHESLSPEIIFRINKALDKAGSAIDELVRIVDNIDTAGRQLEMAIGDLSRAWEAASEAAESEEWGEEEE